MFSTPFLHLSQGVFEKESSVAVQCKANNEEQRAMKYLFGVVYQGLDVKALVHPLFPVH